MRFFLYVFQNYVNYPNYFVLWLLISGRRNRRDSMNLRRRKTKKIFQFFSHRSLCRDFLKCIFDVGVVRMRQTKIVLFNFRDENGSLHHLVCIFVCRHLLKWSLQSCTQLRRSVTSNTKSTISRTMGVLPSSLFPSSFLRNRLRRTVR